MLYEYTGKIFCFQVNHFSLILNVLNCTTNTVFLYDPVALQGVIKKRKIKSVKCKLQFHHISLRSDAKCKVMQNLPLINSL